jgi:Bacterial membrane protein YfhO
MQTVARMSRLDRLITDRRLTAFIGAVAGIFVVLLFLPTLRGQIFTGGDLLDQNFPFRKFYADCLHSHQSFLWSPPFYGGFYLYGEGQTGMLHPLHLLLYTVSPLKLAFAIEFVSSYLFMLGGGYFLFRRWAMSPPAALFGAFIFTFGSVNLSRFQHMNAAAVAAHLPWILLSLERVFDAQTRRSRVLWSSGFALLIASQLLTGHPPAFYLSSIIAAWYLVYLLIARPSSTCLPAFFALLIGGALGLMIGAVQILPTLDVLRDSRFAEPTLAYLSLLSLKPAELLQWVNPFLWQAGHYEQTSYPYHELFIYSGGTVILLGGYLSDSRNPNILWFQKSGSAEHLTKDL